MESWKYASDGKGFVLSDELGSTPNAVARSKKMLMGLDLKVPSNYENNMPISSRRTMENQGFMELGFSGMTQKPLPDSPTRGLLGGKFGTGRVNSSSYMITPSAFVEGNPSSMSQDLPLIDLKLGSLADHRDPHNGKSTMLMPRSSSEVSHAPSKRARSTILNPQTPLCQVHGCNLDLSSSKDYHKRHKVCDVHSKTPKVIVNGIEQRFCQQCSRFHLLDEFDNGKRSCRKRLAGHNERRRKPKLDNHSGNRLLETLIPRTSFIFSDILPNSILRPEICETGIWRMDMKVEDKAIYNPRSAMPTTEGHLLSKTPLPIYKMENSCSSIHANGIVTAKSSILSENNNCYPHNLAGSDSIMSSLFENNSSKAGDLTVFNLESNIEGLSGVSDSGCALSLLSSQSQNSSDHLSEIPMDQPLNIHGGHAYFAMGQVPEKLFGVTSQVSTSVPSNRFSSSQMNSTEVDQLGSVLISGARNTLNLEVHTNGMFAGSEFLNDKKHRFSPEHGCTVDMLQLSSQLQRVERQRQYMQGQQQNDAFCFLPIT